MLVYYQTPFVKENYDQECGLPDIYLAFLNFFVERSKRGLIVLELFTVQKFMSMPCPLGIALPIYHPLEKGGRTVSSLIVVLW